MLFSSILIAAFAALTAAAPIEAELAQNTTVLQERGDAPIARL